MRDRWVGRNVDLNALMELLKQFFEEKKFRIGMEKKPNNYRIVAALQSRDSDLCDSIEVVVRGVPDDFIVEFGLASDNTKAFIRLGGLTSLFGGGYFLLRGLKSREELDKLENDFWNFIDMKLPSLEQKQS